ncbi:MAG: hypothetical protein NWE76_09445, partial [Candidatus Bathyarchaeota archaeon]|nr:hypothetical protein [Candidatus Bathyarchaeota archaeon]
MTRLERLYPSIPQWTYQEIDLLVKQYLDGNHEVQATLLQAFHNYLMKYSYLLKGRVGNLNHTDTMEFLSLFLPGSRKTSLSLMKVYRQIVRICRSLEVGDIYNELCVFFIVLLSKYKIYEGTSFTRYLTKHIRWDIKDWIERMARDALCRAGRELLGPLDLYNKVRRKKFVPHRVTGGELITTLDDEVMRIYKRDNLHLLEAH